MHAMPQACNITMSNWLTMNMKKKSVFGLCVEFIRSRLYPLLDTGE